VRYELYPESETATFALEWEEGVSFVEDADGHVEALIVGEHGRCKRVK
jgi:hypothetical protein